MFGRKKSYDLEDARNRNHILSNAGIASVGTQGTYTPLDQKSGAKVTARQKKLPKQQGFTKQKAIDEAKIYGEVVNDMRGDILGFAGDWASATKDIVGAAKGEGLYTTGGGIEFGSAGDIIGTVKLGYDILSEIYEWSGKRDAKKLEANPILSPMDANSYQNTKTAAYFKKRCAKKIGGAAVSFSGGVLSGVTHVNALGAARHGRSDAKTIAHLVRLNESLSQFKGKGLTLEYKLCELIIDCKKLKLESQTAALATDCIPGNVITGAATAAAGFIHGQSLAYRLSKLAPAIDKVAKILHYRAFHEMNIDYGLANMFGEEELPFEYNEETPALNMVRELFAQAAKIEKERVIVNIKGHKLKVGGEHYRADKLMREPAGWLTIVDKLTLI
ncbi:hypothetical protein [Photobacterium sanguinicancri]|uniref:hypothetical protein n=1 Tax=Photobacterium sanguinicancri TaxID=875932 RepID=UPI0026E1769E|nr:hypothetical protein [Photobacterium sanguinicancri]MDO6496741.1 hypothetical protein [Photobacterium sanguinicancri]